MPAETERNNTRLDLSQTAGKACRLHQEPFLQMVTTHVVRATDESIWDYL